MSDILAEVDEAMRQEKLEKFWHDNKTMIIAFIVLTILSTGIVSGYRSWDTNVKTQQTQEVMALLEASDYPNNLLEADLDLRPSLEAITLLTGANTFIQQEKPEEALKLYSKVLENKKIPDQFRHLAILMDVRMKMDTEDADKQALLSALNPVLKGKSPWTAHAQIDAALLNAESNPQEALTLLNAVSDTPNLPESLYERAEKLHHVIEGNIPAENSVQTN